MGELILVPRDIADRMAAKEDEIKRLRAEVKTARKDALKEAVSICERFAPDLDEMIDEIKAIAAREG